VPVHPLAHTLGSADALTGQLYLGGACGTVSFDAGKRHRGKWPMKFVKSVAKTEALLAFYLVHCSTPVNFSFHSLHFICPVHTPVAVARRLPFFEVTFFGVRLKRA